MLALLEALASVGIGLAPDLVAAEDTAPSRGTEIAVDGGDRSGRSPSARVSTPGSASFAGTSARAPARSCLVVEAP